MEDKNIVRLLWRRDEKGLAEMQGRWGNLCHSIAYNILGSHDDRAERTNDVWLAAWNAIPPAKPEKLGAYLAKTARNISLNMWEKINAAKRGGGQVTASLSELEERVPRRQDVHNTLEQARLTKAIEEFLKGQSRQKRNMFIRRYFRLYTVKEIAAFYNISENKVSVTLLRLRKELKNYLEKEGFAP